MNASSCGAIRRARSVEAARGDVGRMAAGLHQLLVQLRIGLGKLREKDLIEPDQALAPVQVGDREPVRKDRHFCSIHIRTG